MVREDRLKQLGEMVKEARIKRKWTLADLNSRTGISSTYLSNIENGYSHPKNGRSIPSDDKLQALATELSISLTVIQSLLGRTPEIENLVDDRKLLDTVIKMAQMTPSAKDLVREMVEAAYTFDQNQNRSASTRIDK